MGTQHGQRGDPKCQLRTSASSASLRLCAERPPAVSPRRQIPNPKSQIPNRPALPPLRVLRGLLFKPSDSPMQANARTCKVSRDAPSFKRPADAPNTTVCNVVVFPASSGAAMDVDRSNRMGTSAARILCIPCILSKAGAAERSGTR